MVFDFVSERCSSRSRRRETMMFILFSSILRILHSTSLPRNSPMSSTRRTSTCEAGRNTGTPTSTSRPPLIFRTTRPLMTSPSLFDVMIRSQPRIITSNKEGDVIKGRVVRKIKGGLLVDVGVPVFLPASQVDVRRVEDIGEFLGKEVECKILKIDEKRMNIIVSRG